MLPQHAPAYDPVFRCWFRACRWHELFHVCQRLADRARGLSFRWLGFPLLSFLPRRSKMHVMRFGVMLTLPEFPNARSQKTCSSPSGDRTVPAPFIGRFVSFRVAQPAPRSTTCSCFAGAQRLCALHHVTPHRPPSPGPRDERAPFVGGWKNWGG